MTIKESQSIVVSARYSPQNARWVFSNHLHGNEPFELPIKYDIQENHTRLDDSGTLLL